MLTEAQIIKFKALIELVDSTKESPFKEYYLDVEWIKKEINKILEEK